MSGAAKSLLAGAELLELSPDDVEVGTRVGFLHDDVALAHGRTMAAFGQRDPIKVRSNPKGEKPWLLVTGRHRLEGARREGLPIYAIVVEGKPEDFVDMEASENLHRRDFAPIERAMFVHSLVQAARDRLARTYGNLSKEQLAIKIRWERVRSHEVTHQQALADEASEATACLNEASRWTENDTGVSETPVSNPVGIAGEALNLGKSAIHRSLAVYRGVIEPFPEHAEALSKHPIVGTNLKQLLDLSRIGDEGLRRDTIEALLADPEIGVDDAKILAGAKVDTKNAPRRDLEKHQSAITSNWDRLNKAEKAAFLSRFVNLLTPALKRDLRDRLNEELGE